MKKQLYFLLSFITFFTVTNNSYAGVTYAPAPETLEELVSTSDVIITGKIDYITNHGLFYGYNEVAAEELRALDLQTPITLGILMTDLHLKINKLLKGDKAEQKNIVLRVMSGKFEDINKTNKKMEKNKGKIKEQVFFLRENPDNTYSLNTVMGALFFEKIKDKEGANKEMITFNIEGEKLKPFDMDYISSNFIKDIEDLVSN